MALTGFDRCDRCRAQAYIHVEFYSGLDLMFCGYHFAEHREVLEPLALRIQNDIEEMINAQTVSV